MIFLTGFMGSGKTTVGRHLSKLMSLPLIDLDNEICTKTGCTIPDIFKYAGEKSFRMIETEVLTAIINKSPDCVVATGGGLPVNPLNSSIMKSSGVIVNLGADFATLRKRLTKDSNRPLWNEDAQRLYEKREAIYQDADFIIDTVGKNVRSIAAEVRDALKGVVAPVPVILGDDSYPVYIGQGIFRDILMLAKRHIEPEGIFVMVDENVYRFHGDMIKGTLSSSHHHIMIVPSGEQSKSYGFLKIVLDTMFSKGLNRNWLCLAVGGGVTGDLAGFASSIFMRGIPVAHVATTLLAQVDSSIGGKTAINNEYGKNLVGTFCQPVFVLSDTDFLKTLDETQMRSAMAEVIKYGVIMDKDLFSYIEENHDHDLETIVRMCSINKASVVSRDEREGGLRRILNFGHTIGHAIEKAADFDLYHGQAVGIGMVFAAYISREIGMLCDNDFERICALIMKNRIIPDGFDLPAPEEICNTLSMDKKGAKGGVHFVLTPAIGDVSVKMLPDYKVLDTYKRFVHGYEKGL